MQVREGWSVLELRVSSSAASNSNTDGGDNQLTMVAVVLKCPLPQGCSGSIGNISRSGHNLKELAGCAPGYTGRL